jgi:hypothetical protein
VKKIIVIGVALTVLLVACGEEVTLPPPPPPNPLIEVLVAVETSFNYKDIRYLENNVSGDFSFHFDADDVGQNPPGSNYVIPASWTRTEFLRTVGSLLERANWVSFDIRTSGLGEPAPNETTYRAENVSIKLLVMVDALNGYIADTGYCNFEFEKYRSEGGADYWRLTEWWDYTSVTGDEAPGLEPASLGRILALYK